MCQIVGFDASGVKPSGKVCAIAQASHCGGQSSIQGQVMSNLWGEVALGKFFCEYFGSPYQFLFRRLPLMSSGAGKVGPLRAYVPAGPSRIPLYAKIKYFQFY